MSLSQKYLPRNFKAVLVFLVLAMAIVPAAANATDVALPQAGTAASSAGAPSLALYEALGLDPSNSYPIGSLSSNLTAGIMQSLGFMPMKDPTGNEFWVGPNAAGNPAWTPAAPPALTPTSAPTPSTGSSVPVGVAGGAPYKPATTGNVLSPQAAAAEEAMATDSGSPLDISTLSAQQQAALAQVAPNYGPIPGGDSPAQTTASLAPYVAVGLDPSGSYPISSLSSAINTSELQSLGFMLMKDPSGNESWVGPNAAGNPAWTPAGPS